MERVGPELLTTSLQIKPDCLDICFDNSLIFVVTMTKEKKFYKALQDVFVGAKIEGKGGFVNLMRIKSNYYSKIEELFKNDI